MRISLVALLVGLAVPEISEAFNLFSPRRMAGKSLVSRPIATEEEVEKVSIAFVGVEWIFSSSSSRVPPLASS